MHANSQATGTYSALHLPNKTKPNLEPFSPNNASLRSLLFSLKPIKPVPIQTLKRPKETKPLRLRCNSSKTEKPPIEFSNSSTNLVALGAVSVGVALLIMGFDEHKALAFGPEGPLVEEFWDNMRRYALYVVTVSTGALYIVFQPILELLKNPISAILILAIVGGGIYIVSQVLSAMVGVSDFTYDYNY